MPPKNMKVLIKLELFCHVHVHQMKNILWDGSHGGRGGGAATAPARDWHGWRAFLNGLTDFSCPAGHDKG